VKEVQVLGALVRVFSSLISYRPTSTYNWVEKVELVPLVSVQRVCVRVRISCSNYYYYYFMYIDRPIHV
jgi:hypothetical protein